MNIIDVSRLRFILPPFNIKNKRAKVSTAKFDLFLCNLDFNKSVILPHVVDEKPLTDSARTEKF